MLTYRAGVFTGVRAVDLSTLPGNIGVDVFWSAHPHPATNIDVEDSSGSQQRLRVIQEPYVAGLRLRLVWVDRRVMTDEEAARVVPPPQRQTKQYEVQRGKPFRRPGGGVRVELFVAPGTLVLY